MSAASRSLNCHRTRPRENCYTDLSVVYEGLDENVPVAVPNLSPFGMFIPTPRYFPYGAVLKMRFRLLNSGIEVMARAEVRHCAVGLGVGVEFVGISPDDMRAIEEELNGLRAIELT